ncbi:MAG: DUF58 domain-containing protein [Planctomycetota bacterium]|nr:MAG: DUF58 domain-containing protein [Planctomycetota bacterium]REJ94161.1 MAG: DUF58 domain-containing protein [Planctomycetota bacterium]REK26347.1 MAG: DUF58 domain-containing protein [Planctomycetota bacterium]REK45898.1 MAG: DUF58 domain-containing protein [Planctomycetota bacterium]
MLLCGLPVITAVLVFAPGDFGQARLWVLVAFDAAVVLLAFADLFTLPRQGAFSASRSMVRIASLGKSHDVELVVSNHSERDHDVKVRDDLADELVAEPEEFVVRLRSQSRSTLRYRLKPQRRGAFRLARIYLQVRSRMTLWRRFLDYAETSQLHVYPDMKQLSQYAVLARTNRLTQIGVRKTRRVGQDHDFERLRDYTIDDNYKHIDWRSTARRNRLTVKDFQASQSQRIVFLMDCGRMMTNHAGGISLLDHGFNAMLMLSYVALRQGDSVGMIAFSDRVHGFVPPGGGMNQMNHLLHASFDRFPETVESRYDQAFLYLAAHCRKRALVVLISNVIDEVNAHQVERYLGSLTGRHLPVGVLLRDHALFGAADMAKPRGRDLYRAGAAAEILAWRRQVLQDLQTRGVLALDVFPENLTAPLVNQYLTIKARHLL